ncbi:MAG: hypothetical protein IPO53_09460 [Chitinophagaceae bacterium]|nr:hypothetical protein [Chitinophagaceae bacterium]
MLNKEVEKGGNEKENTGCRFAAIESVTQSPEDTIARRIVLIGDAEITGGRHPVVDAVRDLITLDKKPPSFFWVTIFTQMAFPMISQLLTSRSGPFLILS